MLLFSRPPDAEDLNTDSERTGENALSLLVRCFPKFLERIRGREILDYGCGSGHQAVAMARAGAKRVVGVDTNAKTLQRAQDLGRTLGVEDRVLFVEKVPQNLQFDLVVSQNSMEHYADPRAVLDEMLALVRPEGRLLITFGPPWYAPYGSHMHFFTRFPWVNLLFSERTVMRVRSRFRADGAQRYEDVEGGLNRMTVRKFERLLASAPAQVAFMRLEAVKGLNSLGKIPLLRELFVNQISCELVPMRPGTHPGK